MAAVRDPALVWNEHAGDAAIAACLAPVDNPLHESRMYAIAHIAIHDAVNAIERRYDPYEYRRTVDEPQPTEADVAAAARRVHVELTSPTPAELSGPSARDAGVKTSSRMRTRRSPGQIPDRRRESRTGSRR